MHVPRPRDTIAQAHCHILKAHAERGELVTVEDIEAGRAPRPRVLDMFAGGGAIPLAAATEAYLRFPPGAESNLRRA